MALNFPASPSSGDTHNSANGLTYYWDGVKWTTVGTYTTGNIYASKLDNIASGFNGSTATFTLQVDSSTVKPHNDQSVMIVVNNVVKEPTTAYTVNSSTGQITFTGGNIPTNGQTFWGVIYSRLPIDMSTGLSKTGGTMTGNITFANSQTFAASKLSGTIATASIADDAVTADKIADGTLDGRYFTETESDARYFRQDSTESITSGDTWSGSDTKVATSAAIDARITDLVDDVGGFGPIANETSFPAANPDVNNGAGTLVSVKEFASSHTPSGGTVTIANGAGSGNTITITGCGSTVLAAGFGGIVETTTTLHTYTFHRLTPKATEVTTVATNVTNIGTVATNINAVNAYAEQYQIKTTAPTTDGAGNSLADGDLWFDSSSNKIMMVYDGSSGDGFSAVTPTQSVLADISNVSGQLTYAEDLGSIADALTTETGNNINTVATNINDINTFSDIYRVASSAPSSSLDGGDLWYDTTGSVLKYYNGSSWVVTAAAGLSEVSGDTTPELGGHLDCNDKNLTEVGTVSGDNLQIDFGAIA